METKHCPEEVELLAVLKSLQGILATAVDSLGGIDPKTRESHYVGWAAAHVNRIVEGYVWLREPGRVCASKLFIRPMVETVLRVVAITRRKGFLFRQAFTEWEEDMTLFERDPALKAKHEQELDKLESEWRKDDPGYPFLRKPVGAAAAAKAAGLLPVYESAYRIYCKFTHGAMRAVRGGLDELTDELDSTIAVWCTLTMLIQLQTHTPAQVGDLAPHLTRVQELLPDAFSPAKQ